MRYASRAATCMQIPSGKPPARHVAVIYCFHLAARAEATNAERQASSTAHDSSAQRKSANPRYPILLELPALALRLTAAPVAIDPDAALDGDGHLPGMAPWTRTCSVAVPDKSDRLLPFPVQRLSLRR